ncbi:MAG TPA: TIGR04255 family protein [Acidimicrobiales bacterium]|nr:TIGR04255 family protein [Acidimicrobiales bacterium]
MTVLQPQVPFGDEPIDEIFLPDAPLITVVAQLRFPDIASIAREDFIGGFQEAIRADYPVLRQEREVSFVLTPRGIGAGADSGHVWRFRDKAKEWSVSLAPSFVALDTTAYVNRADFVARLGKVLEALAASIAPATYDRFGLRYVDRIILDPPPSGLETLNALVRQDVRGISTSPLGDANVSLQHTLSASEFRLSDAVLFGRWGVVPPDVQLDPSHGDPVPTPSWLLDLDMYVAGPNDFAVAHVLGLADDFAGRIYRFFRWAVNPELLKRCGGAI